MSTNKVLVVDDEISIQRICSLYLEAEGLSVRSLSEASRVVEEVLAEKPDVIVMDVNMPGTNGFEATKELKSEAETAGIPVLILSGRSDVEDKRYALEKCGADDYMTKPFDPEELVARISVLCRRKKELEESRQVVNHLEHQVTDMQHHLSETLSTVRNIDDFLLDVVDKEFREPVRVIGVLAGKIAKSGNGNGNGNGNGKYSISGITEGAKQLQGLVDKLAEMKSYRLGKVTPNNVEAPLGSVMEPLVRIYETRAEESGVSFTYTSEIETFHIKTDPERLRRVLGLILDHAFDADGATSVKLETALGDDNLEIKVIGITAEGSAAGSHAETNGSNGDYGAHLVLPLARHIVNTLAGSIEVHSTKSSGAVFSVVLPVEMHKKMVSVK